MILSFWLEAFRLPEREMVIRSVSLFNYGEAWVWWLSAVGVWHASRKFKPAQIPHARQAMAAFVIFGFSDIIEAQTGAWWRPWWLFVLKAGCVITLTICYLRHHRM